MTDVYLGSRWYLNLFITRSVLRVRIKWARLNVDTDVESGNGLW